MLPLHLFFLGIALDSVTQVASLPTDKLVALDTALSEFVCKHRLHLTVTKRMLLSLIGKLTFAAKVVPAGRFFTRRLLDTAHSFPQLDQPLLISDEAALDMKWWLAFATDWNGKAFFLDPAWRLASAMKLYTDASSKVGLGAFWDGRWFAQRGSN